MNRSIRDDAFGFQFVASSYEALVRPADLFFGIFCISSLVLATVGWLRDDLPPRVVAMIFVFLGCNIAMSRIAIRLRERRRVRAELIRIFVVNGILCPLALWATHGTWLNWWPCYFIPTLGAAAVLGGLYPPSSWVSAFGVAFWGINFFVANAVTGFSAGVYQPVLQTVALLMTGFVLRGFIEAFARKARAEHAGFENTLASLKAAQNNLVESGKLVALGQMAGGIAHEINSPLTAIQLATRQIRRATQAEKIEAGSIADRAKMIDSMTARIEKIILGLRAFCNQGEELEPFKPVTIEKVIRDTLVFCEDRFRVSGIVLTVDPANLDLILECRQVQLSQVLVNLLNNAHDAVRRLENRWVRLKVLDEGDKIKLLVEDSGNGVPEAVRAKVFDAFFTTKGPGTGTGLGLSISKRIIEAHHGSLTLASGAPHTTFVMELLKKQARARALQAG